MSPCGGMAYTTDLRSVAERHVGSTPARDIEKGCIMVDSKFKKGDRVRVKKVEGPLDSKDWELMRDIQTIDFVGHMPLNEDENNHTYTVEGFSYMLLEWDLEKAE